MLFFAPVLHAATPYLVKDINTQVYPWSSYPDHFVTIGAYMFFTTTNEYGDPRELWRTDGTDAGTVDLGPAWSKPIAFGGKAWYLVSPSYPNHEIWSSDGTVAGTQKLTLPVASPALNPNELLATQTALYFYNYFADGDSTQTIWTSNGTTAGTHAVTTNRMQLLGDWGEETDHNWAAVGSSLYYVANNGGGWTVWRTDGVSNGLADPYPTSGSYTYPTTLKTMGNVVIYLKPSGSALQLWRTDGTAAGTFALNGPSSSLNLLTIWRDNVIVAGTNAWFVAADGASARKIWRTDGTNAGTTALPATLPLAPAGYDSFLLARLTNGTLILFGPPQTSSGGPTLWSFDGTNMTYLATMQFGNSSDIAVSTGAYAIYGTGPNLWRTDGTIGGTYSLGAIDATDGYHNFPMAAYGSNVLFAARDNVHGFELWKTDGTIQNTGLLKDLFVMTYGSNPRTLRSFRGGVLFLADGAPTSGGSAAIDLWFSDGTEAGTQMVMPDTGGIYGLVPCGGIAYFAHYTPQTGSELWTTDGTTAGTSMLLDLYPGTHDYGGTQYPNSGGPSNMLCIDNKIYFGASNAEGRSLWRSDGTVTGTFPIKTIVSSSSSGDIEYPTQYGHGLFFISGNSLWASNGTAEGTKNLKNIGAFVQQKPYVAGSYYYVATGFGNTTLWRSDASAAGTTSALVDSVIWPYGSYNGRLIFMWGYSGGQSHGYCSMGPAGDTSCFDANIGYSGEWKFVNFNGKVAYNRPNVIITDLSTISDSGVQSENILGVAGGRLYIGRSYENLRETDGTAAGTSMLLQKPVNEIASSGGRLFMASDELWAYDMPVTPVGMAPASVPMPGGQQITITGRGFVNPIAVTVGGSPVTLGATSATSITFTAPNREPGAFTVTITNGDGRVIDVDQPLTYTCAAPSAVITSTPAPVCPLTPVQLQGSGGTNCHWYPATGLDNPASCSPVATLTASETYTLVVDNNGCPSVNHPKVTITVNPLPDPSITFPSAFSVNSTGSASVPDAGTGASYSWTANGGIQITGGATSRTVTFATSCTGGKVFVTVTNGSGCSTASSSGVPFTWSLRVTGVSASVARPGTIVTLTGAGFACANQLTLAQQNTPFTIVNDSTIRFAFPVSAPSRSDLTVSTPLDFAYAGPPIFRTSRDDFDNDLNADIVWRNNDGTTLIWSVNPDNTLRTFTPFLRNAGTTDFNIAGIDELGGWVNADVLWQRTSTGELSTLYTSNGTLYQERTWPVIPPATLKVAATGDFDGDGWSEILMRDTQTGATSIWKWYGTGAVQQTPIHPGGNLSWKIIAARDFNFDGKDDILWRNSDGMTLLWFMNGAAIASSQMVHSGGNNDWTIAGVGDFDADGYTDILWRHDADGMTLLWRMNGASIQSSTVVHGGANLDWDIAGVGDFNRDHKADVLWRNKTTGMTIYWQMNGPQIVSSVVLHSGGNPGWQIVGPRF